MADIFISYSRKDIAFARPFYKSLIERGFDTWIDWIGIPLGENWWHEVCDAIANAHIFLLFVSRHSVKSNICRDETQVALRNHKRIIPIRLDNIDSATVEEFVSGLSKIQWIAIDRDRYFQISNESGNTDDSHKGSEIALHRLPQYAEAIRELDHAIHTNWEWVRYHTQLQVDALRWANNQRDSSYLLRWGALQRAEKEVLGVRGKEPGPTDLQVEYIVASREEETRDQEAGLRAERKSTQRLRWGILATITGMIVAIFLSINWYNQRNEYFEQKNIAL